MGRLDGMLDSDIDVEHDSMNMNNDSNVCVSLVMFDCSESIFSK